MVEDNPYVMYYQFRWKKGLYDNSLIGSLTKIATNLYTSIINWKNTIENATNMPQMQKPFLTERVYLTTGHTSE